MYQRFLFKSNSLLVGDVFFPCPSLCVSPLRSSEDVLCFTVAIPWGWDVCSGEDA